jgi:hypothetical protein
MSMEPGDQSRAAAGRRHRHAAALGVLGAASGVVTGLIFESEVGGELVGRLGPALIFGAIIGGYVQFTLRSSHIRLAILLLFTIVSWNLAIQTAVEVYEQTDHMRIAGIVGGFVGALVVAGAAALLNPALRRARPLVLLVFLGTLTGALLGQDAWNIWDGEYDLFVVWQACVAGSIGMAIDTARRNED